MLLPTVFDSFEADYHHLKNHVQIWDVACERQVEVKGPDASLLIQMLTPRNLAKMKEDQCYYIPVVDETGGMLNDPVAVKHSSERWWISLADSDLLYWIKGLAIGRGLKVDIFEPDVSPLAIQGPKSPEKTSLSQDQGIPSKGALKYMLMDLNMASPYGMLYLTPDKTLMLEQGAQI